MTATTHNDTVDHREHVKHTRSTFGMFRTLGHYIHTKTYPGYDFVPPQEGCHLRGEPSVFDFDHPFLPTIENGL